jgi:arylsulfatase A-like enzyme
MSGVVVLASALCAAFARAGPTLADPDHRLPRPNIVLILVDDVGVDLIGAYGEGASPPCTPNIDSLAGSGLLFRNAWSNPICSPTRAQILTGLHGFRTGIGAIISRDAFDTGLSTPALTLPRALVGYDTSLVGKWHLAAASQGLRHPLEAGYDYFAGSMYNLGEGLEGGGYTNWLKNVNGVTHVESQYATTDTASDAVERAASMQPPWFLYVSFNAAHIPAHDPPLELCQAAICAEHYCPPAPTELEQTKAAVEALDTEIGNMLAQIRAIDPRVCVIFAGDNGTTGASTEPPFLPEHGKGRVFEGGLNVPLIVNGPGVWQGESGALVSLVDLFATITELAEVPTPTADSVSFAPLLWDPGQPSLRPSVYAERFGPNFDPAVQSFAPANHARAIRNERFKLTASTNWQGVQWALFDLPSDPFEQVDLYPPVTADEIENFDALLGGLVQLGVACAADANLDGVVSVADLGILLSSYGRAGLRPTDGDADRDGDVDITDLAIFLGELGFCQLPQCPGDVNGDGVVTLNDLAVLLSHFGVPSGAIREQGDLTGDGAVNAVDLGQLLGRFGLGCE